MHTERLVYLKGESEESVELFEPLWQTVLEKWRPKHKVALILPCSWGKPYWQSYVIHTILSTLMRAYETYANEVKDTPDWMRYNILDLIDIWHMSSCGFVPSDNQLYAQETEAGRLSFCAYDWNSEEASKADTQAWFVAALRRTKEWFETFGPKYEKVVVFLRNGSKSQQVVSNYIDGDKFFDAYYIGAKEYPELRKHYSLGGRLREPDLDLLNPDRISYLALTLHSFLRHLEDE